MENIIEIPALVDLHVHFREPGFEYKETIESGARAADAAGYSDVFTMPNLKPAPDTIETLQVQTMAIRKAEEAGCKTCVFDLNLKLIIITSSFCYCEVITKTVNILIDKLLLLLINLNTKCTIKIKRIDRQMRSINNMTETVYCPRDITF